MKSKPATLSLCAAFALLLLGCSEDAWRDAIQGQPANLIVAAEQVVKYKPSEPFDRAFHHLRMSSQNEALRGALFCKWLYLMRQPATFSLGGIGYASADDLIAYRRLGDVHEVTIGDVYNEAENYQPHAWRFVAARGNAARMELKSFQTLYFPATAFPYLRCVN